MSGVYPDLIPHGQTEQAVIHRLTRLIQIMRLLEREQVSRADLAARHRVSERMITYDLRTLRLAGVDIRRNRSGYWIEPEKQTPRPEPKRLSEGEVARTCRHRRCC